MDELNNRITNIDKSNTANEFTDALQADLMTHCEHQIKTRHKSSRKGRR
jgi:hypothetical protein